MPLKLLSWLCNNVRETQIRGKGDGSDSSHCFRIILEYFLADIVALCTGLKPVVIIDIRKMFELQERLFALVLLNTLLVLLTAIVSNFIDIFVILSQIIIDCRTYLFLFVYQFNFISYMLISTKVQCCNLMSQI